MEDVDEKLLPGWSAEYIDASALPRVSPVCEEADGVCCAEEELVAAAAVAVVAAGGPPVVRDESASAAAGFGEEPWLLALAPAVPPLPPLLGEGATVPLLVLPVAAALPPPPPLLFWEE